MLCLCNTQTGWEWTLRPLALLAATVVAPLRATAPWRPSVV